VPDDARHDPEPGLDPPEAASRSDWRPQLESLGQFIRAQRRIAGLTLRQLADIADVSNAYLSQIERGKHEPSVRVLRQVARGLNVSAETILDQAGLFQDPAARDDSGDGSSDAGDTTAAIVADPRLTGPQKDALLAVYRSYLAANSETGS